MYRAPKGITSHPAVEDCADNEIFGGDSSEYKHDVLLKDGWAFTTGRMEGCRNARFKTVADFKYANPQPSHT